MIFKSSMLLVHFTTKIINKGGVWLPIQNRLLLFWIIWPFGSATLHPILRIPCTVLPYSPHSLSHFRQPLCRFSWWPKRGALPELGPTYPSPINILAPRRLGRRCVHGVPAPLPVVRPTHHGRYWLRSSRDRPICLSSRPTWLASPPIWVPNLGSPPSSTGSNEVLDPLHPCFSSDLCSGIFVVVVLICGISAWFVRFLIWFQSWFTSAPLLFPLLLVFCVTAYVIYWY